MAPLRPKCRPPRPQPLVFSIFRRGGLHFEHHTPHTRPPNGGFALHEGPTRRRHAARGLHVVQNPQHFLHVGATSPVLPGRGAGMREKTRPAQPLQRLFREKTRPASPKTPKLGCFQRAGRTISRTGRGDMATLKPMTPLQPLMQATVKPPSPLLAPLQQPLKPTTPLQPNNARKPPMSDPQRRWRFQPAHLTGPQRRRRFQLRLDLHEQRRHGFHAKDLRHPRAATSTLPRKLACSSIG